MTAIRRIFIGLLSISLLLGVASVASAATVDLSATGHGAGSVDASGVVGQAQSRVDGVTSQVDGTANAAADATATADAATNGATAHAGLGATLAAGVSGALAHVQSALDGLFAKLSGVGGSANADGSANAHADTNGGASASWTSSLAALFHL